ncbi:10387_t:CDS:2 [Funneliformis mosseae]|uniref:10387_t:CDS:1 n=1 Tax=Funneliformis mosseae TaxID=27381 RepID=A0A9N9FCB1_FUNMO|nr:10387_t:CDS:2 [Funneliformis mosseae]
MSLFVLDNMVVDESGDTHENKRVKITTACDACRRRKVKCDGASPCTNCQRGGYQCSFSDASSKRPRGPPKGFVALIEDRLHTIESLLVKIVNKDDLSSLTKRERLDSTSAESSSAIQKNSTNFKDPQYATPAQQNHLIIPSTPPSDSQISDASQNHLPGYTEELTIVDEEILLNNLVDPNLSNTLQSNRLSFLMLDDTDESSDYVEPALPTSIVELKPIPEQISRHLFENYFNHFHPYFPIVDRVQFFRSLNNTNVQDQPSELLVETICTIGAMYPPNKKQNVDYSSQFFYERAKILLDHFIEVPRLSTIQALVLLCLVHQGKPSSYRSQTYSSTAIKMAQSIGLNRKNGAAYKGAKNRHTKKLVWWGCFILDRLTSLMTGDPLIINDKMCDIELPSLDELEFDDGNTDFPSDNEESSQNFQQGEASQRQASRSTSPVSYSSMYKQQINTFINFIRLTKLTGQILEHLQTNSCEGLQASWNHHSIINIFESSLSDWVRELPPYLNYAPSTQDSSLPGQIASLHMYHQTLHLLLYYPYIAGYSDKGGDQKVRTTKTFTKSMNICSSAASIITNIGVESLNNVQTCVTFPAMFYCLGKAAKVHSKNILSPQRALAIDSYRNIVKTIRICQYYKQNNIMKELAQKTFNSLENILKKYQDKFSHEEIFGVTPSGQIVNPDGLDLIISSFGLNNSSSIGIIKISPTMQNQTYSKPFSVSPMKSVQMLSLQTSPSMEKRNQVQQSNANFDFLHQTNNSDESQPLFANTFDTQMIPTNSLSQSDIATTSANEPFWMMSASQSANLHSDINSTIVDGEFDVHSPFDHMTIAESPVSPPTNYFSSQSRSQSLPSPSSPVKYYMQNGFKSQSLSSNSRQNQMSLDSIDQETHTSPNSPPNSQHSKRYVSLNTNENQVDSFPSENNNSNFMSERDESSMYDDDSSRMRFYNNSSTATNDNYPTTSSPSQSRIMRSPPSSSSGLKKKASPYTEPAIHVLSKRHNKYCRATIPTTSICIGYDGIDHDYQFESNVAFGFENSGI